tara:strand:+ start:248 stop:1447 length:1200 start_codon:yes stop_codon:yes gene_type:complete
MKSKKSIIVSESILSKRITKFKSLKRGYYSFIILVTLYILSIFAPLLVNNQALIVKYDGNYYFPAFSDLVSPIINAPHYEGKDFGQDDVIGTPKYRNLQKKYKLEDESNYVVMPIYPYSPIEILLDEFPDAEKFNDQNKNEIYDKGETFSDTNGNGIWDDAIRPPTSPDWFSGKNFMGTDNRGRDVFARLIYGFQISITFSIIVATLSYAMGIIAGGILAFYAGKVDLIGVRFIEIYSAFPFLYLLMILSSFLKPNIFLLGTLLVVLSGWIGICYYIRGEFYREKAKDYVSAAVSMGQSNWKIMFKHILPNSLTPVITFAPFAIIGYISTLTSLDFLGFGLQPPTPSWGELIRQGYENLESPHLIVAPLLSTMFTLFLITFIGEAVREAFDPKVNSRLR